MLNLRRICALTAAIAAPLVAVAQPLLTRATPVEPGATPPRRAQLARLDHHALRAAPPGTDVILTDLPGGGTTALELTRFSVTTPDTRFVLGIPGGPDTPIDFDPADIVLLRGNVAGEPHSHVFLALSDRHESTGRITLAPGHTYGVSSRSTTGLALEDDQIAIYPASTTPAGFLGPTLCATHPLPLGDGASGKVPPARTGGTDLQPVTQTGRPGDPALHPPPPATPAAPAGQPLPPVRLVEVAVETDYEYFELFGDLDAAAAYVIALYAVNADLYIRDLRANPVVTYVRLWDTPDDLFNSGSPLSELVAYWLENMPGELRNITQLLSGRRDLPYGGVAFLGGVCDAGFSVSAYTLGRWGSLDTPSVFNRDIVVSAHEMGHNFGTLHTHDFGVDNCDDPDSEPQRGTIMSYCSQTFTGGSANIDLRFHAAAQDEMLEELFSCQDLDTDYNLNAVPDADDIANGTSADVNLDGIPDEAQDCNANGLLDPEEIAKGIADDVDRNGIPDDCQPDCNANGLPDSYDIQMGFSADLYGDWIPDECDQDCDDDAGSDYNQIQLDMTLDINRNARLDHCEDCDDDGTPDLDALGGAGSVWLAGAEHNEIIRYLSVTGVAALHADESIDLDFPSDVRITPDRRVIVADSGNDRVLEYTAHGDFVTELIPPGAGGLDKPGMMAITPDARLLVTSRDTHSVLAYDLETGAFLETLVQPEAAGLTQPAGITLGDGELAGSLFVTSEDGRVLRFDAASGASMGDFVSDDQGFEMDQPRGIMFLPGGGDLLLASHGTDEILRYDRATGDPLGRWNKNGTSDVLTMKRPWAIRLGPDGNVYASRFADPADPDGDFVYLHLTDARIHVFDPDNGNFLRSFIQGANADIEAATGFDFLPNDTIDCNLNLIPDSCDIAAGTSADANGDGVPDECQQGCPADANGDGELNVFDFISFQTQFTAQSPAGDCDGNGAFDILDFICFQLLFAEGCD